MSSEKDVPGSSNRGLAPWFWGLMVIGGLAVFLWNFGLKVMAPVGDMYPKVPIADLFGTMFIIAMIGGGITVFLIAFAIFRYSKPNRSAPTPLLPGYGKYTLTFFAIGITFLFIATMFMGTHALAVTDEHDDPVEQFDTDRELTVDVLAAQFLWTIDADDGLPATEDTMVIPADTVIHVETQSEDVIHSFKIQEISFMKDAVPGTVNNAWFHIGSVEGETEVRARTGHTFDADVYTFTCAELCGEAHSDMTGEAYVMAPDDYEEYVEAEGGELPDSFLEGGD